MQGKQLHSRENVQAIRIGQFHSAVSSNYVRAGISFHQFPLTDEVRLTKWLHILKIGKSASKGMTVCSDHFLDEDYHQGEFPIIIT